MSSYLKSAVITAAVSSEHGCIMLADALDMLFEHYELGFRGYGGVMRLRFDGREYRGEEAIDESVAMVEDLDQATIEQLVARYRWITVTGSFAMEGLERALDIKLVLYPTFDAERPVCMVSHLDAYLYESLWSDDDALDVEAAERLRTLAVMLGGHELTDGFYTTNIEALDEVVTFDGAALRDSFVEPTSVAEARKGKAISHGSVSGIKSTLLTVDELRPKWGDGELFETVNGFSVLSCLVEVDESLLADDP